MEPIFKLTGNSADLDVYEDRVVIIGKPTFKAMVMGTAFTGRKEHYFSDLTSVTFAVGQFISFETPGSQSRLDTIWYQGKKSVIAEFEKAYEYIKERLDFYKKQKNSPTIQTALSPADELKKFKELLDIGAITQEEFNSKKNELLNQGINNNVLADNSATKLADENKRRLEEELRIDEERQKQLRLEEERREAELRRAEEERQRQIRIENEQREAELRRITLEKEAAEQKAALERLKKEAEENARIQKEKQLAEKAARKVEIDEKNKKSAGVLSNLSLSAIIIFAAAFVTNLIVTLVASDNIASDIFFFIFMFAILAGVPFFFSHTAIKTSYGINGAKKVLGFVGNILSIAEAVIFLAVGITMLVKAEFTLAITFLAIVAVCVSNIVFLKKVKKVNV